MVHLSENKILSTVKISQNIDEKAYIFRLVIINSHLKSTEQLMCHIVKSSKNSSDAIILVVEGCFAMLVCPHQLMEGSKLNFVKTLMHSNDFGDFLTFPLAQLVGGHV